MSSKMMQTRGRKASLPGCHRFRLVVEELEFRWVPSTFLWDPPQADRNWTAHENSRKYDNLLGWLGTNNVPGANDDVEFKGEWEGDFGTYEANKPCIIDQAVIVKSIKMYPDYSSTLYLQSELRIDRALWMLGPGHISGYPINGQVNRGPLITDGLFEWRDGTLINVTVEDKGILTVDSISTPEMSNAVIDVQHELRWKRGNVAVSGESVSGILIQSQGTFDITAEGSWGGNPARLNVTNNGTLTLDTQGIASISGGYVTMGTTKLNSGTLALGGQANQTAA